MARRERPPSKDIPGGYIAIGVILAVLTGLVAAGAGFDDGQEGPAYLAIGSAISSIFLLIGIIAKGVAVGIETAREKRQKDQAV